MNAPQGPNDANQAWAPSPEQSDNPAAPESHDPNPYGANPYAGAGYSAPEQGQMPGQYNQYGQPYPGAPGAGPSAPTAQWGAAPQPWGQQPPTQQAPSQPGQPVQQAWNAQPAGAPQPGSAPQWGAPAPGQPQWGAPQGGYPQAGGYPQQGFPTQQFGAPQQNQWGAPVPPASASSGNNKKILMLVGILVAAVVVVGGVLFAVGSFGSKTLDQTAAQKGVEQIVTESYGARSVSGVSCPSGQKVEKGASFECSLTVDGTPKKVTVTFTDDEGTYEVSRPN